MSMLDFFPIFISLKHYKLNILFSNVLQLQELKKKSKTDAVNNCLNIQWEKFILSPSNLKITLLVISMQS